MLNTNVLFSTYRPSSLKHLSYLSASKCQMKRTVLAADNATEERLIAPRYMIQISAHLAFSYTKHFNCRHMLDKFQSEFDLHLFFAHKYTLTARCSLREDFSGNVTVFNVYKIMSQ